MGESQSHESNPEESAIEAAISVNDDQQDWSQLPAELLEQIALKNYLIEDIIIFSSVCRSWHRASTRVRKDWHPRGHQIPWIVTKVRFDSKVTFYNPNKNTSFRLTFPEEIEAWGSSNGWTRVKLEDHMSGVADVTYWNGLLHIMFVDGAVAYSDITKRGGSQVIKAVDYLPPLNLLYPEFELYMVESLGNLLMIHRHIRTDLEEYHINKKTVRFEVHVLDLPTKTWKATSCLEDVAIYVSESDSSMSVSCASADKLNNDSYKPNCIYFIDDKNEIGRKQRTEYYMGSYNMEDDTFRSIYTESSSAAPPELELCPLWFMPMIR